MAEFTPIPAGGRDEFVEPSADSFTPIPVDTQTGGGFQPIAAGQQEASGKFEQIKEIPRSIYTGVGDAFFGVTSGIHRGGEQIARKLEAENVRERDNIIAKGGDAEGWRAQAFDTLANFHGNAAEWWGGETGAQEVDVARKAFLDKNEPLTQGIITDVARGVGGLADLIPAALSGGLTLLVTAPSRMFDEGYQDSIAEGKTGQEALDTATAYAFLASPLELVADAVLLKGKGKATKRALMPILKQVSKKTGLNFVSEGSTEVLQDAILNKLNGRKMFTPESMRTFVVSGLVGTIGGGGPQISETVKAQRMVKHFETSGMSNADAIEASNLLISGKVDEAVEFVNDKVTLRGALQSALVADEENNPISEKDKTRLEALRAKEVLTEDEEAELGAITLPLDESEIDTIYNNQGKTEVRMFAERVASGETLTSPADLQFQQNNAQAVEQELQAIQKEQEAENASATQRVDETQTEPTKDGQETPRDSGQVISPDNGEQVAGQERDNEVENKFFDAGRIRDVREDVKSRRRIVQIPIDSFLEMADDFIVEPSSDKVKRIGRSIDAGSKIKILPELVVEVNEDGTSEIVEHDGRHRALALKERGVETMPVIIEAGVGNRLFWDKGGGFNELSTLDVFPTTLKTERGDIVPFPLDKDGAQIIDQSKPSQPVGDQQPVSEEKPSRIEREAALDAPIDPSDTIGFSTAALNEGLVESGQKPLTEEQTKAHQTSMQNAIAKGLNDTADDLAGRVLKSAERKDGKTYQMSDEEVAGMGARVAELRNERGNLFLMQKQAMEAGDQVRVDEIKDQLEQNIEKAKTISFALKTSATASGRANSMMASIINRFSYDVVGLTDAGRNAKGAPLTDEETASLVDSAEQITVAENELAEAQEVNAKASQLEKLQKRLGELQEQQKGQFRNIKDKKKDPKAVSAEIQAIRDEIADVTSLISTEDKFADLLQRIRNKESLVPTKKEKKKESRALTDAKVKLKRLRQDAKTKVFALHDKTFWEKAKDVITLPRAALATGDLSGALRQGMLGLFQDPKSFAKAFGKGLNATFNQYNADAQDIALREHPEFDKINELVTISSMDSALKGRDEEMFASHLIEKIPVLGKVARASERNMVTLLNQLRFGIMLDYMTRNPNASQKALERMGKLTDAGTGRGNARFLDTSGDILSVLAFAPRFAYSRVQAPFLAAKYMADPELRKEIVKQWGSMLITGMTILTLAKAAGAEVGDDVEDSDWGKIIVGGNKRIDIWGGMQQPMRILMKAIKGGVENATEGETGINPIADVGNYLKYKMSPPFMMMNELLTGEDIIGRETATLDIGDFETPRAATVFAKNMFPIVLQSALDSYLEGESAGTTAALMAGEGLGLSIGVYDK